MQEIFLPTLSSMEYGNVWTGSRGLTRWRIEPKDGTLHAAVWHGQMCLERSQIDAERDFPLTAEGRESLRAWLAEQ